ncbi:glycosyltransferase family 2 protein [Leifsonia sp. PS1209]|uniref:glycosyltransferase family 2 protein n=1 Tax=Leifsonia sp. PS1209 TaxID=2724914 RepID=UPI001442C1EF|nr:glycosyltransferase family 2 protein [Leifsonia sp. PS1209]QIZ97971.1 glycosyltransferase family 2 protein [Leifsonia sp. PS1209]
MPFDLSQTLIVMPAFNEEASVAAVVAEVYAKLPGVTCLVVDDGSTDDTARIAKEAGALVASMPFNMGVGGALRLGYQFARDNGFSVAVQIDADGQHDPGNVPSLIAALDGADLVIGARFSGEGDYEVRGPRRWAMNVLSTVLSRVVRTRLNDTTSGFKAAGPRAIALFAHSFPAEYLGDTIEALVIAARGGLRVAQVPTSMRPRAGGQPSHNPLKAAVYLARAFIALLVALMRPRTAIKETATA